MMLIRIICFGLPNNLLIDILYSLLSLDVVFILSGEVISWSLVGVKVKDQVITFSCFFSRVL